MVHAVRLAFLLTLATLAGCDDSNDDTPTGTSKIVVSIKFAEVAEGNSGDTTTLSFALNLNEATTAPVDVTYKTSDGTALAGTDYTAVNAGMVSIPAGDTSATIDIDILGDDRLEDDDTFDVTLLTVSDNAELSIIPYATGTILNDDPIALNDSGITFGSTAAANNANCSGSSIAAQDCSLGRDNTNNDNTDGHAGFSFTKLDNTGAELAAAAASWSCVQDEVTGLIWEVKTNDGALRDRNWRYTYFDSSFADEADTQSDGGADRIWAGPVDDGAGTGQDICGSADSICTTESFVASVNDAGLCGFNDWRLPTREELRTIVTYNAVGAAPAVDSSYFPNMVDAGSEWTSSPVLSTNAGGALVNQRHSLTNNDARFTPTSLDAEAGIRLVRYRD